MYNKASLTLKDINNKIQFEIFGIEYNVSVTRKYLDKLEELIKEDVNEIEMMKKSLDEILGEGQYDKLKAIYEEEQKEEFDDVVWYNVIVFLAKQIRNYFNSIETRENNYNREYRRNNNRNWRNNYRRY